MPPPRATDPSKIRSARLSSALGGIAMGLVACSFFRRSDWGFFWAAVALGIWFGVRFLVLSRKLSAHDTSPPSGPGPDGPP